MGGSGGGFPQPNLRGLNTVCTYRCGDDNGKPAEQNFQQFFDGTYVPNRNKMYNIKAYNPTSQFEGQKYLARLEKKPFMPFSNSFYNSIGMPRKVFGDRH